MLKNNLLAISQLQTFESSSLTMVQASSHFDVQIKDYCRQKINEIVIGRSYL